MGEFVRFVIGSSCLILSPERAKIIPTLTRKSSATFCSAIFAGRGRLPAVVRRIDDRPVSRPFQTGLGERSSGLLRDRHSQSATSEFGLEGVVVEAESKPQPQPVVALHRFKV